MRILWLKNDLLHPVNTGGRIRTYQMLRQLKCEHQITYLALEEVGTASEEVRQKAQEYCHELIVVPHPALAPKATPGFYGELFRNLFSPLPHFVDKFRSPAMKSRLGKLFEENRHDVFVCDFLSAGVHLTNPNLPISSILFQHNVEAVIWQRFAEVEKRLPHQLYLRRQWEKAFAFEKTACHWFDRVVAVSPEDEARLQQDYGIMQTGVVPLGVDTEYFAPNPAISPRPNHLVFMGSMNWLPNNDGIIWFLETVWPELRKRISDVTVIIVGREPSEQLRRLAEASGNAVQVTGGVPDVRSYLAEASVFIVPLRIGGGTRLKIYEALSMNKPVISTTVGAEGLPLENGIHLLKADTPADFLKAITRVLSDQNLAAELGKTGGRLVREQYGWKTASDIFAMHCQDVIRYRSIPTVAV